eukprot:TRINITY_DN13001_c0_g1_i4.p1 TRINITY_DN13001_c0_g1~~TRINITY_DN13001_c0_g1_i4.p1  ORF type:complete len:1054 (+),score=142.59 TRINITY_DN13001_c0_g1_i4:123-3284(+)
MSDLLECLRCQNLQKRKWFGWMRKQRMQCSRCGQRSTSWRELPDGSSLVAVGAEDIWEGRRLRIATDTVQDQPTFAKSAQHLDPKSSTRSPDAVPILPLLPLTPVSSPAVSPKRPRAWVTVERMTDGEVTLAGDKIHRTVQRRDWAQLNALGIDELQLDVHGRYIAKDARGKWWPVVLVALNPDGTYRARVFDGRERYQEWAVVLRSNVRKQPHSVNAASLQRTRAVDEARQQLRQIVRAQQQRQVESFDDFAVRSAVSMETANSVCTAMSGNDRSHSGATEWSAEAADAAAARLAAAQRVTEARFALWAETGQVHPLVYEPSGAVTAAGVNIPDLAARVLNAIASDDAFDSPALGVPTVPSGALCRAVTRCAGVRAALGWPAQHPHYGGLISRIGHDDVVSQQDLVDYLSALQLYDTLRADSEEVTLKQLTAAVRRSEEVATALQLPSRDAVSVSALWEEMSRGPHRSPATPTLQPDRAATISFESFFLHYTAREPAAATAVQPAAFVRQPSEVLCFADADAMFGEIDTNDDKSIDLAELRRALASSPQLAARFHWPSGKSLSLFNAMDKDSSGDVSKEELTAFLFLRRCFTKIDMDRGGYIDAVEFSDAIRENLAIQRLLGVSPSEAQSVFVHMDVDGSGAITFDEFCNFFWDKALDFDPLAASMPVDSRPVGEWYYAKGKYSITDDWDFEQPRGGDDHIVGKVQQIDSSAADTVCPQRGFVAQWFVSLKERRSQEPAGTLWLRCGPKSSELESCWQPHSEESFFTQLASNDPRGEALYTKIELLGRGGFGSTWLVVRQTDGLQLALKEPDEAAHCLEDAVAEMRMLRRLKHRNVVRLCDSYSSADGRLCLVTELAQKGDLCRMLDSTISDDESHRMFRDVCLGLRYLHDRRVVHRDVKPGNVVIANDGTAKLCDAGLMLKLKPGVDTFEDTSGTVWYFGPELLERAFKGTAHWHCSYPVDVWALGCVLYEMCLGQMVFPYKDPATGKEWSTTSKRKYADRLYSGGPQLPGPAVWCHELLCGMLRCSPDERITAAEALERVPQISGVVSPR